jgi:hypothetical protein
MGTRAVRRASAEVSRRVRRLGGCRLAELVFAGLRQCSGMSPERQGTGLYLIASPNELAQTTRLRCTEQAKSKNLDQPLA